MVMVTQLWPEFQVEDKPRWVREVLDEAGRELKAKTKGVVELRIIPFQSDHPVYPFGYECQLSVPKLEFVFLLFRVLTDETGSRADVEGGGATYRDVCDADQLRSKLAELFHSERTQRIVQNLISMAQD
jgi:hypothetical protein